MAGYCKNIKITMTKDHWIKVEDDGRGIPTAIHELKELVLQLLF